MNHRRATLTEFVENDIKAKVGSTEIQEALAEWLEGSQDSDLSRICSEKTYKAC